jgi:hypothetical protein
MQTLADTDEVLLVVTSTNVLRNEIQPGSFLIPLDRWYCDTSVVFKAQKIAFREAFVAYRNKEHIRTWMGLEVGGEWRGER